MGVGILDLHSFDRHGDHRLDRPRTTKSRCRHCYARPTGVSGSFCWSEQVSTVPKRGRLAKNYTPGSQTKWIYRFEPAIHSFLGAYHSPETVVGQLVLLRIVGASYVGVWMLGAGATALVMAEVRQYL